MASARLIAGVADKSLVDVFDPGMDVGDDDALRALLDRQRQLVQLDLGLLAGADAKL